MPSSSPEAVTLPPVPLAVKLVMLPEPNCMLTMLMASSRLEVPVMTTGPFTASSRIHVLEDPARSTAVDRSEVPVIVRPPDPATIRLFFRLSLVSIPSPLALALPVMEMLPEPLVEIRQALFRATPSASPVLAAPKAPVPVMEMFPPFVERTVVVSR